MDPVLDPVLVALLFGSGLLLGIGIGLLFGSARVRVHVDDRDTITVRANGNRAEILSHLNHADYAGGGDPAHHGRANNHAPVNPSEDKP